MKHYTLCSLLAGGLLWTGAAPAAGAAGKRNVLLICVDDLRPVLGYYEGQAKTPNLDRFAESAVVFTRHYVQWPVCGPSRASLMSGLRPDSTRIYGNSGTNEVARRPETHPTLPLHFREHGYVTLSYGKTYHGLCAEPGCGWSEPAWRPPSGWTCYVNFPYPASGRWPSTKWRPACEIYDGPDRLHNDYQTAERVTQALEKHRNRPFFIAAGFYKPHLPFVAPKHYWDLYDGEETTIENSGLPSGAADFAYNWSEIWSYGVEEGILFSKSLPPTAPQERDMVRAYYAAVSFIDAQVGRILEKLEELGLADNTAVVLWGDHGFHLGDHNRWAKHTQFENNLRSPLVARFPGRQAIRGPAEALAETVDIYPSLCEYAGLDVPEHVEGASFVPFVNGETDDTKAAAYSQITPVNANDLMAYTVRTRDFRYVEWRDPNKNRAVVWRELYDHRKDPDETRSLVNDPEYAGVVERHARLVRNGYASLKN